MILVIIKKIKILYHKILIQQMKFWKKRIKHKFYTNSLTDLKFIFYCDNNTQNKEYKPLLKLIEKAIK